MSRRITKHQKLTEHHFKAINLMLEGHTDSQVAKVVEVAPETISRWKNHQPLFKAELERQRSEILNIFHDKQVELALRALRLVEDEIGYGEIKAATDYLKIVSKEILAKAKAAKELANSSENIGQA